MNLNTYKNFHQIVIDEIPLIDVRAPIEFEKGSFKNAFNLPLMTDEERHLVGICYKEKGNEEAVKLGHQLVSGKVRKNRIGNWITHLDQYPNSFLYCFRGGLRSQISQEWILESVGKEIPRLEGGYKAFRNYLIQELDPSEQTSTPILLGGYTGSGKTILLQKLDNAIDLEGLANHRGSSFGKYITPQPTQINFENNLAYALIQHRHYQHIILEDEGTNIGKCFLPKPLFQYFNQGDLVLLDTPFEERVEITVIEYVIESQKKYAELFGEKGLQEWIDYIRNGITRIKKRLGGERYQRIMNALELAVQNQICSSKYDLHKSWIAILLNEYYDPMYQHQIKNTTKEIIFKGNSEDVLAYLRDYTS